MPALKFSNSAFSQLTGTSNATMCWYLVQVASRPIQENSCRHILARKDFARKR